MKNNYSVALCTFNGQKYIVEQLISILNQTYPIEEIIIVDDKSTDNTIETITNFLKDNNIHKVSIFVNQKNLGVSKNFEKAISLCKNDFIFLSDQDDIWHKNKVLTFHKYFSKGYEMIFSDAFVTDSNLKVISNSLLRKHGFKRFNALYKLLIKRNIVTGATMAINRNVFLRSNPFPDNIYHDSWLSIISSLLFKTYFINKRLIYYRQHENNVVGIKKTNFITLVKRNLLNKEVLINTRVLSLNKLNLIYSNYSFLLNYEMKRTLLKSIKFWTDSLRISHNYKFSSILIIFKNFLNYFLYSSGLIHFFRDIIWLLF